MAAILTGSGCNWRAEWVEEGVVIEANHVVEHSDAVSAELLIKAKEPKADGYATVKFAQLNLKADRSREQLAKRLVERWPGPDWDIILEELACQLLGALRQGEDAVEVIAGVGEEIKPPSYALWPFVYEGLPTLLFATWAGGKSSVAMTLAMIAQLHWNDNPLGIRVPGQDYINTLYLDYETNKPMFQYNLSRFVRGYHLPETRLTYRHCTRPFVEDCDAIQRIIDDKGVDLIVIDSVGMAAGTTFDMKDSRTASVMANVCRQWNKSFIWVHHTKKGPLLPGEERSSFGSTYFEAEARQVFYLATEPPDDPDIMDIAFTHKKNSFGRKLAPFAWRYRFDDMSHTVSVGTVDVADLAEASKGILPQFRIQRLIQENGKKTAIEIAEELNMKDGTVRHTLKHWTNRLFVEVSPGSWGLFGKETV